MPVVRHLVEMKCYQFHVELIQLASHYNCEWVERKNMSIVGISWDEVNCNKGIYSSDSSHRNMWMKFEDQSNFHQTHIDGWLLIIMRRIKSKSKTLRLNVDWKFLTRRRRRLQSCRGWLDNANNVQNLTKRDYQTNHFTLAVAVVLLCVVARDFFSVYLSLKSLITCHLYLEITHFMLAIMP